MFLTLISRRSSIIQCNHWVSNSLKHFNTALSLTEGKCCAYFHGCSLLSPLWFTIVSNRPITVHFCLSWIHKTRDCFLSTFRNHTKICRASITSTVALWFKLSLLFVEEETGEFWKSLLANDKLKRWSLSDSSRSRELKYVRLNLFECHKNSSCFTLPTFLF